MYVNNGWFFLRHCWGLFPYYFVKLVSNVPASMEKAIFLYFFQTLVSGINKRPDFSVTGQWDVTTEEMVKKNQPSLMLCWFVLDTMCTPTYQKSPFQVRLKFSLPSTHPAWGISSQYFFIYSKVQIELKHASVITWNISGLLKFHILLTAFTHKSFTAVFCLFFF